MDQPALSADLGVSRPAPSAALRAVAAELRRDAPLLGMVGAYTLAVWGLCEGLGKPEFFHPFVYMKMWMATLVIGLTLAALVFELPKAIHDNPRSPLLALAARMRGHLTPRFMSGVLLFASTGLFTGAFTCMKSLNNELVPFGADEMLANLDAALHFGVDPWRLLQPLLGHHLVTRVIQNAYMAGWLTLLLAFTGLAIFNARLAHVRGRFLFIYFASWIVLGNVLGAVFMSGGPAYYGALTGDHARFAEQLSYLSFSDGMLNSSFTLQHVLWALSEKGQFYMASGISAFPSLHVATVTLFALTAFELDKRLGWAATAFAVLIFAGSVHLGWHYAVDGYFSAAVIAALWYGGAWLARRGPSAPR